MRWTTKHRDDLRVGDVVRFAGVVQGAGPAARLRTQCGVIVRIGPVQIDRSLTVHLHSVRDDLGPVFVLRRAYAPGRRVAVLEE